MIRAHNYQSQFNKQYQVLSMCKIECPVKMNEDKNEETIFSTVLRVMKVFQRLYLISDFTEKLVRNYLKYYSNKKLSK